MSDVVMDRARAILHGQEFNVVFPDAVQYAGEERYDARRHKGHLTCRFCEAAVHYNKGAETIAGQQDIRGAGQHFHTNPGQTHEASCLWKLRVNEDKPKKGYDTSAGYRIHLNTMGFTTEFNEAASRLYYRDADKKLVVTDPTLKSMEPFSVRSVDDLTEFMKGADPKRLVKSRVIHNGWDLPWAEFMVRYNRNPQGRVNGYMDMVERLQSRGQRMQPVLMEFDVRDIVYPRTAHAKVPPAKSKEIVWRGHDGQTHVIRPRAYLDNRNHTGVSLAFAQAGKFLLLGYSRLHTTNGADAQIHYLNMSLQDHRQISRTTIEEIGAANALKHPR